MTSARLAAAAVTTLCFALACGQDEASSSEPGQGGTHHDHDAGLGGAGSGGASGGGGVSTGGGAGAGGAAGASGSAGAGASAGAPSVVCDLGTMYPGVKLIDPDAPVYSDSSWTQAKVSQVFVEAKGQNTSAYLGYKAARDYAHVLDCAFCSCGCFPSIGHLSAIDCFKDMHGFT